MKWGDRIKTHLYNAKGWHTRRKIVVFESDDWGCLRVPPKDEFERLAKHIPSVRKNAFNRVDGLETQDDLERLFDLLGSFRDIHGNPAVLTANFVTCNPDYKAIKESGFEHFIVEDFPLAYSRTSGAEGNKELVSKGIADGCFFPQFHGREHVQAEAWLRDLFEGNERTRIGFDHHFFAFNRNEAASRSYLSAFDAANIDELAPVAERIRDGLDRFERLFGFRSRSVIAPQNTLHYDLFPVLAAAGVDIIQGARVNKQSAIHVGDPRTVKRFTGRITSEGQLDIARNVTFEPSASAADWVEKALAEMAIAFAWGRPAVICTHRYNFMGGIEEANRDRGLRSMAELLKAIQKKWPSVEFMTTVGLADTIRKKHNVHEG